MGACALAEAKRLFGWRRTAALKVEVFPPFKGCSTNSPDEQAPPAHVLENRFW